MLPIKPHKIVDLKIAELRTKLKVTASGTWIG